MGFERFVKVKLGPAVKDFPVRQIPTLRQPLTIIALEDRMRKCQNLRDFNQILSQMIVSGFIADTFAASRLLKFSTDADFVHLEYSRRILDQIQFPNGFIWNTMMRAYAQRNSSDSALALYKLMLEKSVESDNYTYPILAHASALRSSELEGKQIHNHVLKLGFDSDVYVKNTLINMYAVCGKLCDARRLFDESVGLDSISWNSLLAGYVQIGDVENAKLLFDQMPERNTIASNSMIALFGRTGLVTEARQIFDEISQKDVVSWSALISSYEQNGMLEEALIVFKQMHTLGIKVDEVAVVSVLSACGGLSAIKEGELVHGIIIKMGIETYINLQNALIHLYSECGDIIAAQRLFDANQGLDQISWNSMISGYLKCGQIEHAEKLFDSMPNKDVISWSAMISGYAQHNQFAKTLTLFNEMQLGDTRPDETTLVSVISACAHLAALDQGKWVHAYIDKYGLKINPILGTTLVDMYMKCGCVESALEVFYKLEEKGVSTWNAMILGLAMNGLVEESLDKFLEMNRCGVAPNEITFIGVLGACRHVGLVDEGRRYFHSMIQMHNLKPNVKHYGCMVDLLGRAGLLKEAEEIIESMPMAPDVPTWGALLGACRKYGNTEMGERVGRKLIELQPDHDGFHVLLSNIYASKGKWDDVIEIRGMMKQHGVVKTPGCSLIEANGIVHEFLAGDRMHPQIAEIDRMLDEMAKRLKMEGYAPETNEVALDIDAEEKESILYRHSEKLAIAFGLISIKPPIPIRIMKNLRICADCHTAAKLISRAFAREIIVRDRHRFHHFRQGLCSCKDYW